MGCIRLNTIQCKADKAQKWICRRHLAAGGARREGKGFKPAGGGMRDRERRGGRLYARGELRI